jgi:hypothetical protein
VQFYCKKYFPSNNKTFKVLASRNCSYFRVRTSHHSHVAGNVRGRKYAVFHRFSWKTTYLYKGYCRRSDTEGALDGCILATATDRKVALIVSFVTRPHITKPTHTYTQTLQNPHIHTHTLQNPHIHTHKLQNALTHTHTHTHTHTTIQRTSCLKIRNFLTSI